MSSHNCGFASQAVGPYVFQIPPPSLSTDRVGQISNEVKTVRMKFLLKLP